ncbi:MAG: alpha/beta hydrolase [Bacteroidota bacterium]|nr:alpha/beta hydrolase [Bacteroidota bacterium]
MKKTGDIIIKGSSVRPIMLDICYIENDSFQPIVIFCHGFKGFKNWGHFDLVAEEFCKNNFVFLKFNFSFNGTTVEQPTDFADLDAFAENNFTVELNDLGLVIDFIEQNAKLYSGDPDKIYLMGHSRGGGTAILKTHEDKRIKKLETWASVKDIEDFVQSQDIEKWKNEGILYTFNSRTNQNMPLNYQLYENYIANKERLNIPGAAKEIEVPWLIVHGTNDSSVPYYSAEQLHEWNKKSELFLIEDADHTFGGKHPWTENKLSKDSRTAVEKTIGFFRS